MTSQIKLTPQNGKTPNTDFFVWSTLQSIPRRNTKRNTQVQYFSTATLTTNNSKRLIHIVLARQQWKRIRETRWYMCFCNIQKHLPNTHTHETCIFEYKIVFRFEKQICKYNMSQRLPELNLPVLMQWNINYKSVATSKPTSMHKVLEQIEEQVALNWTHTTLRLKTTHHSHTDNKQHAWRWRWFVWTEVAEKHI